MRVSGRAACVVGLVAGIPATAAAHAEPVAAASRAPLVALLVLGAWLYARGVARLGRRWPRRRIATTAGGIGAIVLALLSPLDALAASSVTAHMAQHALLILVAAPLLALGRPFAVAAAGLRAPGARRLLGPRAGRVLGAPRPGLACGAHALALWVWHLPPLYDVALARAWVHALAHATLLGTAILLWSSVTRGARARRRRAVPLRHRVPRRGARRAAGALVPVLVRRRRA